jgi:hypothetical protein
VPDGTSHGPHLVALSRVLLSRKGDCGQSGRAILRLQLTGEQGWPGAKAMAGNPGGDARWDWLYRLFGIDPEEYNRQRPPPLPPAHIFETPTRSSPIPFPEQPSEKAAVADHTTPDTFTGRALDYAGMGFLLVPPEIFVLEVVLGTGPINWTLIVTSFIGCYVVGGILLALGLSWPKVKPALSANAADSISRLANNSVAWVLILTLFAFGPAVLVGFFSMSHAATPTIPPSSATPPPRPIQQQNPNGEIPGIPPTEDRLRHALDTTIPELSSLMTNEGAKLSNSLLALPGEAPNLLINSNRDAAISRINADRTALHDFSQHIVDFKNQHQLDAKWINWIFGSDDFDDLEDTLEQLRSTVASIPLPPSYSPQNLLAFWRAGQMDVGVSNQVGQFAGYIVAVKKRIQTANDEFEKRISKGNP